MKIHYISHACLLCETNDLTVIMDPWYDEAVYRNHWHINPQPSTRAAIENAEAIAISHGHEDHMHYPTLQACNKQAKVYHPLQFSPGSNTMFRQELGFKKFHELPGNRTVKIAGNTKITFVPVGHDSIIVLEADGEVLVNVNDALHSAPVEVIYDTTAYIKKRFPKIDYMSCGYGGASYYPNCIHGEHKQDYEIAQLRECLFARNFCLVAHELLPGIALPFAADFVLLHDHLRWINDTRFDRNKMGDLYAQLFGAEESGLRILPLTPGQALEHGNVCESKFGEPNYLHLNDPFEDNEIAVAEVVSPYAELIRNNISRFRGRLFPFSLAIYGEGDTQYINVQDTNGTYKVEIVDQCFEQADLVCKMSAANVEYLLKSPWNSDVIIIGYGIDIQIRNWETARNGAVSSLENLLTHYPNIRHFVWRNPLRVLRYLWTNHISRSKLKRKFLRGYSQPAFFDVPRQDWLVDSPETLAARLKLPPDCERYSVCKLSD